MSSDRPIDGVDDASAIEVQPAMPERWPDVLTVFGGPGIDHCWCQYWPLTSRDFSHTTSLQREALLRASTERDPAPGVIAYVDGEPAGWCGFGPSADLGRLVRSRTIPRIDDRPVWSVFCFLVRVGYRRKGVGHALLRGAIEYARGRGTEALEAYPVDTGGRRIHGTAAYVGTTAMFEAVGFERILVTQATSDHLPRWLMRLELG